MEESALFGLSPCWEVGMSWTVNYELVIPSTEAVLNPAPRKETRAYKYEVLEVEPRIKLKASCAQTDEYYYLFFNNDYTYAGYEKWGKDYKGDYIRIDDRSNIFGNEAYLGNDTLNYSGLVLAFPKFPIVDGQRTREIVENTPDSYKRKIRERTTANAAGFYADIWDERTCIRLFWEAGNPFWTRASQFNAGKETLLGTLDKSSVSQ